MLPEESPVDRRRAERRGEAEKRRDGLVPEERRRRLGEADPPGVGTTAPAGTESATRSRPKAFGNCSATGTASSASPARRRRTITGQPRRHQPATNRKASSGRSRPNTASAQASGSTSSRSWRRRFHARMIQAAVAAAIHAPGDVGGDGAALALLAEHVATILRRGVLQRRGELRGERRVGIPHRLHRASLREMVEPRREHTASTWPSPSACRGSSLVTRAIRGQVHHRRLGAGQGHQHIGRQRGGEEGTRRPPCRIPGQWCDGPRGSPAAGTWRDG